jgi:hypothetical protein
MNQNVHTSDGRKERKPSRSVAEKIFPKCEQTILRNK